MCGEREKERKRKEEEESTDVRSRNGEGNIERLKEGFYFSCSRSETSSLSGDRVQLKYLLYRHLPSTQTPWAEPREALSVLKVKLPTGKVSRLVPLHFLLHFPLSYHLLSSLFLCLQGEW